MSAAARTRGAQYVIAIAGATGHLGAPLTSVIAREYKGTVFKHVLALVRDPSSSSAKALAANGAELRQIDEAAPLESFRRALDGVDAVVDILPAGTSDAYKDAMVDAMVERGIKVFFPCEWGCDRRSDYWLWQFPQWLGKDVFREKVRAKARAAGVPLQMIGIALGFFLNMIFSPFVGFDHANNTYTCWGPPTQRISFTAEEDIGRAVAELACLALDPETAPSVPELVCIAGDTVSVDEAARIVKKVRGDGRTIEVKSEALEQHKALCEQALKASPGPNVITVLRLCMAEGKLDLSSENQNELVNPGQSVFKWRTTEQHAREKKL